MRDARYFDMSHEDKNSNVHFMSKKTVTEKRVCCWKLYLDMPQTHK